MKEKLSSTERLKIGQKGPEKLRLDQAGREADSQDEQWKRLDDRFALLIRTMVKNHDEIKRYFEILIEQHRAEMRSQGEGYRANRDRLDDHEERIQDLEAS